MAFLQQVWDLFWQQLMSDLPDARSMMRDTVRLLFAFIFCAAIGWERESVGKSAGLRTHILVGLGSALFMLSLGEAGAKAEDLTRVAQGVAAGIGFIGGGVILKLPSERRVKGLTTAASVWLCAAVGVAAGSGTLGAAFMGLFICLLVLVLLQRVEPDHRKDRREKGDRREGKEGRKEGGEDDESLDEDNSGNRKRRDASDSVLSNAQQDAHNPSIDTK